MVVGQLCDMLKAMGSLPCYVPRCKAFAEKVSVGEACEAKIDALVPPEVGVAKAAIANFLWRVCCNKDSDDSQRDSHRGMYEVKSDLHLACSCASLCTSGSSCWMVEHTARSVSGDTVLSACWIYASA